MDKNWLDSASSIVPEEKSASDTSWLDAASKPVPRTRSLLEAANDYVIEGANAAAGGVSSAANFFVPGNKVSSFIDENVIKAGEAKQSDVVKDAKRKLSEGLAGASGPMQELGAVGEYIVENPLLAASQAVGSFALPAGAVKGMTKLATLGGAGAGAASTAGRIGGVAAGAAMAGGDAAGTAYELSKKAGATDEQAKAAGRQASVIPALVGGVTGAFGAEKLLAGGKGFQGGIASRALKTGLSEAGQEAIEEGVTQYEGQRAAMPYDPSIDPTKGVAGAAGMGAALGFIPGAGLGALDAYQNPNRPQAQPQPAPVDEVVEPVESDSTSPVDDVIDVEPVTPVKPSEAMGIDRAAGPLSRAAADAVDSGASPAITPTVMANPLVQAAQDPAPTPPVVDTASLKDRTTEELRGFLRNAQDTNIRKAISSELARRKREEMAAMPDPLQQSLIDQPKAPQEQPRPLASLIGGRLTDTDAADLVGKTSDPLRGVIQAEPRETGIQGNANGLSDTGVPAVTGAGAGDTQRPSGVSDAGRVLRRPGKRAVAPADAKLAQGGADRAGDGRPGTGDGTAALNGRPARWRKNALQAKKVARELGLNPEGKRLAEIVAEIDAFDAGGGVAAKPVSREQAIRDAWRKEPRTIGKWTPISVQAEGQKADMLVNQKRAGGDKDGALHVVNIRMGKMLKDMEREPIAYTFRLTADNRLVEEGIPTVATPGQIAAWKGAGFALDDKQANVQDTPQGTERVQAQAQADQAPEATRGDGSETGRVPDTRAGDGVRADGVEAQVTTQETKPAEKKAQEPKAEEAAQAQATPQQQEAAEQPQQADKQGEATDDRDTFTMTRLNRETNQMEPVTFKRGEYVRYMVGREEQFGDIDGISQARREFSVDGIWFPMGYAYKAERPAAPERKDMVPMSKVIEKMNAKNGEGLTDADRVPEQKPASKTPTFDRHSTLMQSVREGKATADQFKAEFELLVENKATVVAELDTMTKAELLKAGGYFIRMRYANEKKGEIIDAIYRQMVSSFVLGDTLSYGMGKGAFEAAVRKHVEATDDAKLEQYAKDRQAAIAEAKAERAAKAAALENPQTLADFKAVIAKHISEGKSSKEAFLSLTPEQRIQFDTLAAEETKDARETRKRMVKTEVRAANQTTGGEIIATKHTRDGYDLFVVQLADRLSKEDYTTVLASAKRMGGWYSSFRGNGAIPGFQFKSRESADAFLKLAAGDTSAAQEQAQQRRDAFEDDRSQSAVERLREMAEKIEDRANEDLNRERKANTARRARFAAAAERAAEAEKAMARTMRNIAQAIEEGRAKFLDAVRTKSQVEMLTSTVRTAKDNELRAKYDSYAEQEKRRGEPPTAETADFAEFPSYTAFRSDLATLGRQMLEVDGTKKLGQRLMSVADDVSDAYLAFAKEPGNLLDLSAFSLKRGDKVDTAIFPNREQAENAIKRSGLTGKAIVLAEKRGVNRIILSPSEAINRGVWTGDGDKRITLTADFGKELVEAIGARGNKTNGLSVPWQFQNTYDRRKALTRIGIETPSEFRSALREFIALQERATANKVRELELKMVGRKNDGLDFFPTPAEIADQMVEAADIKPDMAVLEPSAGMGHIADRIRAAGAEPDVIEISPERRELLLEKGYNTQDVNDFTDLKPREFYTFGDVFRAPDGTEGIMRGAGNMGSDRVRLVNEAGDMVGAGFYNRSELTGVRHNGSDGGYDRIIMNPPFSNRRDAEHVRHAYTLLKPGGRIVAVMGEGVFFGSDKKAQDFRDWLDSVGGTSEKLPAGSFMDPSLPVNTGVSARMVVIDKPAGDAQADEANFGTKETKRQGAQVDRAVMDMAGEGRDANDILSFIAKTSKSPYRRNLARKLLATGANPAVSLGGEMGGGAGFWFLAKYSRKNHEVTLSEAAGDRAEQIFLHETVHAATLLALDKGGLQAQQMIRLYESAKKQGLAEGQYGMKNVGEFVAEAFTNPEFQKILKSMKAPEGNLWKRFVALVRRILGLSDGSQDMLTAALEVGAKVMRENMPLRAARSFRAEDGPAFAGSMNGMPDNQAPGQEGAAMGANGGSAVNLYETVGLPDRGSALIKSKADGLASRLQAAGFEVAVDHSGSAAGPSSYLRIYDPSTGRFLRDQVRLSGHSKGAHNSQSVWNVTDAQFDDVVRAAEAMRAQGPSATFAAMDEREAKAVQIRIKSAMKKIAKGKPLTKSEQEAIDSQSDQSAPDTDGADAYFGIADASPNNAREAVKPVVQLLNDTFKVKGKLSWWHKTVGTPFNLAQRVPEFKRVFDAVQNFINDVSFYGAEAAAKAPKIIPKLETWKDLGKSPISAEDNKAIAAPIFEGTLVWMRDESGRPVKVEDMRKAAAQLTTEQKAQRLLRNGKIRESVLKMWKGLPADQFDMAVNSKYDKEMLNAGVVWTDAELRNQFKLTDEQIGLYREFREATDKSLVDLALSDIIQYAGKDIDPIKDVIMGRSLAEGSEMVRDYLMEMAEANPERRNDLLDTANGVIDKANRVQQLIDRGYAPLQRFGRYTVYAKDENGEQLFFGMYENRWDAARATRQMRQQFPDATIETGMMSEEAYKLFQGISPETLEIFGTMLGMDSQADGATNEAFQQYLKLAKSNRSAMKRLIERKGIAGYSEDASRVLASFLYSNARQTASNLHVGEIMNGVNDIPKDMGDAKDMAMKLARYTMDPQEEAQALRGLLFAQYLGGSIASAMINALQPAQVTFPYLSQFVGVKKSATIMAQAVKDALKRSTGDARLDAALKKAEDDGIVSPQEIFQLMAQAQGKATLKAGDGTKAGDAMAAASNTLSRLSLGWGKVFSIPEQFNRRSTFIAAYRTAMEKGDRNPAAFAEQAVKETQFVYNKGNRPQWARGSIGALAFTFRTYSLSYVELLQRMAKSGPEGRRAAMLMVGVLFLMAGAGGLPGVEDAEDVVDGIAQRVFGLNFQTRQKRQEWLAELFGESGARFIENGLSGLPWSPTDVSGRLGLGNLIPGTGIFIKKQDYTRDVSEIAGPAADMTKRFLQGAGLLLQGEVLKAGEIVSPVAIRNMIQGGRMAATDQYTDARGRKVIDTTMGEAALKTIGFQPANVARVQDATRTVQQMVALNKIRESEIADKWAKAIVAKDQDGIMDAQQEMRDWNQANPDSPIRIDLRQIRRRVQALREDKTTRIERTAPKEIRQEVRRELEGRA